MRLHTLFSRILTLFLISGAIAACSTAETPPPTSQTEQDSLAVPAEWFLTDSDSADIDVGRLTAAPPRPKVKPASPPRPASKRSSSAAEQKKSIEVTPDFLLGLSDKQVAMLLGPAKVTVVTTPSQVFEYRFGHCRLRLYLYADVRTETYRVLHIERQADGGKPKDGKRCFAKLANPGSLESVM